MVGRGLIAVSGAVLAAAFGLWGHLYWIMTGPDIGFGLREVAPCLVSTAGLCSYPLCGDPLFALAQHASDLFWWGLGIGSLGLAVASRSLPGK